MVKKDHLQFSPINQPKSEQLKIALKFPNFVPEDRLQISENRVLRLLWLGGISRLDIRSGEVPQPEPEVRGVRRKGNVLTASKVISRTSLYNHRLHGEDTSFKVRQWRDDTIVLDLQMLLSVLNASRRSSTVLADRYVQLLDKTVRQAVLASVVDNLLGIGNTSDNQRNVAAFINALMIAGESASIFFNQESGIAYALLQRVIAATAINVISAQQYTFDPAATRKNATRFTLVPEYEIDRAALAALHVAFLPLVRLAEEPVRN